MIEPIHDSLIDNIRAHINSIPNISERMVRISRLRNALDYLAKETEKAKPIDFPLWATSVSRGCYTSRLWIRCDVAEEAHALAIEYVKEPWGIDECGNEANPSVPYFVYLIQGSGGDLYRGMTELLGKRGDLIPGMGNTDKMRIQKIIDDSNKATQNV